MTINYDAITRDVVKEVKNFPVENGELSPGSTSRRYLPNGGLGKYKERIHRDSKRTDEYMNLPFKFSKPKKSGSPIYYKCPLCGYIIKGNKNTCGMICPDCKKYVSLEEIVYV